MDLAGKVKDKLNSRYYKNKAGLNTGGGKINYYSSYNNSQPSFKQNLGINSPSYHGQYAKNTTSISPRSGSSGATAKPIGEIKRFSDKELQSKRQKGLCFRCDDKWSIGHRYSKKELSIPLAQEEEEDDEFTVEGQTKDIPESYAGPVSTGDLSEFSDGNH